MVRLYFRTNILSVYIDAQTDFSVSPCSCSTLRLYIKCSRWVETRYMNKFYCLSHSVSMILFFLLPGSQCVDKMYASLPGARVPLNVFSSWGGVSCHVKLTAVPGSLIRLTIASFLIEPSDCVSDALTVYDALLPMRGRILHR